MIKVLANKLTRTQPDHYLYTFEWKNLEQVRQIYRNAEAVGNFTVFNIKGNKYRLIVGIDYETQTVYYKYLLTHSEYNKVDILPGL